MTEERRRRRMTVGMPRLDAWSEDARQADRNALYEMLFTVVEGSVFRIYEFDDDGRAAGEFLVSVRPTLSVTLALPRPGMFGVLHIGAPEDEQLDTEEAA